MFLIIDNFQKQKSLEFPVNTPEEASKILRAVMIYESDVHGAEEPGEILAAELIADMVDDQIHGWSDDEGRDLIQWSIEVFWPKMDKELESYLNSESDE